MEILESATNHEQLFSSALECLKESLTPERAFILYGQNDMGMWQTQVSHGIQHPDRVLFAGEISRQPLRHVLEDGMPVMLLDAATDPEYADRMSVAISGIRSVVCVAWRDQANQVAGLIYADDRAKRSAFLDDNLAWLLRLAEVIRFRLEILEGRAPAEPTPAAEPEPSGESEASQETWQDIRETANRMLKAGKVSKACRKLRLALKEAERSEGKDSLAVAKTLRTLAKAYRVQHRLEESVETLERAATIFESHGNELELARVLNTMGMSLYSEEDNAKAQTLFKRALKLWRAHDAQHRLQANALSRIGEIKLRMENAERAEVYFTKAYQVCKNAFGVEDPSTRKAKLKLKQMKARAGSKR